MARNQEAGKNVETCGGFRLGQGAQTLSFFLPWEHMNCFSNLKVKAMNMSDSVSNNVKFVL